jgi:hypothetical protein
MEAVMPDAPTLLQTMAAAVQLHRDHERIKGRPVDVPDDGGSVQKAIDAFYRDRDTRKAASEIPNAISVTTPSLTIRKEAPMPTFSDLIKSADRMLRAGRIEEANEAADAALRMVEKVKARTHEDDDDTVDDTWSSAADDDEDDDDNSNNVRKWSDSYTIPGYGGTPSPAQPESTLEGPRQKADTYNTGITPVSGQPPLRTKWDSRVDMIMQRDQVARSVTMTRARTEFPKDYQTYQTLTTELPTNEQHMTRRPIGANKRAPTCYEDLVSEQMLRGCNMEMAKVRVAQLYGYDAQRNYPGMVRKGADLSERFAKIVKSIHASEDVSLEEATRLARHRNQALYRALQSL